MLKRTPQDAKVTELLAEVLLSEREFDQSLKLYSTLLARVPERTDLWNGFLIAAAKVTVMDAIRTQQLEEIYRQRARYDDVGFLANLLNAVDKHGSPRQARLLEVLVTRSCAMPSCGCDWPMRCTRRGNSNRPTCITAGCWPTRRLPTCRLSPPRASDES